MQYVRMAVQNNVTTRVSHLFFFDLNLCLVLLFFFNFEKVHAKWVPYSVMVGNGPQLSRKNPSSNSGTSSPLNCMLLYDLISPIKISYKRLALHASAIMLTFLISTTTIYLRLIIYIYIFFRFAIGLQNMQDNTLARA